MDIQHRAAIAKILNGKWYFSTWVPPKGIFHRRFTDCVFLPRYVRTIGGTFYRNVMATGTPENKSKTNWESNKHAVSYIEIDWISMSFFKHAFNGDKVMWWLTTISTQTGIPRPVVVVESVSIVGEGVERRIESLSEEKLEGNVEAGTVLESEDDRLVPFVIGVHPTTFVSLGMTGGVSMSTNNGGYVGAEASVSRVYGNRLFGLSTDVMWDSALKGASMTIGPKVGVLMLAVDSGLGVRSGFDFTEPVEVGMYGRAGLNLGLGGLYYRVSWWPQSDELSVVHHLGVSIKIPQQIGYEPRTPYE